MPRPQERTDFLLPIFATRLRQWGIAKAAARHLCGCEEISVADFYRILRSEPALPSQVRCVARGVFEWGRDHNMPGWQELEHS